MAILCRRLSVLLVAPEIPIELIHFLLRRSVCVIYNSQISLSSFSSFVQLHKTTMPDARSVDRAPLFIVLTKKSFFTTFSPRFHFVDDASAARNLVRIINFPTFALQQILRLASVIYLKYRSFNLSELCDARFFLIKVNLIIIFNHKAAANHSHLFLFIQFRRTFLSVTRRTRSSVQSCECTNALVVPPITFHSTSFALYLIALS